MHKIMRIEKKMEAQKNDKWNIRIFNIGIIIMGWAINIDTVIGCNFSVVFNKRNRGIFQKNFTI